LIKALSLCSPETKGLCFRGTTLIHSPQGCSHWFSVTGNPASDYLLSPEELQGEFRTIRSCLAPAGSSLKTGKIPTTPLQRFSLYAILKATAKFVKRYWLIFSDSEMAFKAL